MKFLSKTIWLITVTLIFFLLVQTKAQNLDVIVPDFRVNEISGKVKAKQAWPVIAENGNGKILIAWTDLRGPDPGIYGQFISSEGNKIGQNFLLIEQGEYQSFKFLSMSMDSVGNFVLAWMAITSDGSRKILAQSFLPDATPLSPLLVVSGEYQFNYLVDVALNQQGQFIVVWTTDGQYAIGEVVAQIYQLDGTPVGKNFTTWNDPNNGLVFYPSVSIDTDGNFLIVSEGRANDTTAVYYRKYSPDGQPLTSYIRVNDDNTTISGNTNIATDRMGNFVVIWESSSDIYGQRFSPAGERIGTNFKINKHPLAIRSFSVETLDFDSSGNFVVAWDYLSMNDTRSYVVFQKFLSDGTPLDTNRFVLKDTTAIDQIMPAINVQNNGNFQITWIHDWIWDKDVYIRAFSPSGNPISDPVILNEDTLSAAKQWSATLQVDSDKNFIVSWLDRRNGQEDIYAQFFEKSGLPIGQNFKINPDSLKNWKWFPAITSNSAGDYFIVWKEPYNAVKNNLYGRFFTEDGIMSTKVYRINKNVGTIFDYAVVTNNSGNFFIVWSQKVTSEYFIYAQKFSREGLPLGENTLLYRAGNHPIFNSAMDSEGTGNIVIAWSETYKSSIQVFAQIFSNQLVPLADPFAISDTTKNLTTVFPTVSMNKNGDFVIAWYQFNEVENHFDLMAKIYSGENMLMQTFERINSEPLNVKYNYQRAPAISLNDNGNWIIVWEYQKDNISKVLGQRFQNFTQILGENFQIKITDNSPFHHPYAQLLNDRIYVLWEEDRAEGTGEDIWASILDFSTPVSIVKRENRFPDDFYLFPNYPNPFNPVTTIRFSLPVNSKVILNVYDINGRKIRTLLNQKKAAGFYEIKWDGKNDQGANVASGLYLYQLKTSGKVLSRKMLLLR